MIHFHLKLTWPALILLLLALLAWMLRDEQPKSQPRLAKRPARSQSAQDTIDRMNDDLRQRARERANERRSPITVEGEACYASEK